MAVEIEQQSGDSVRYAKTFHLWAMGVGTVISGDFFGWQSVLVGGFWGMMIDFAFVTVLYTLLSFSLAELSTTIPHGGGPYVFALHSMGSKAAFFAGLAEALKVVITVAVANTGIASYFCNLAGISSSYNPIWWAVCYVLFVIFNIIGIELSFQLQLFITISSLIMLSVFFIGAMTVADYQTYVVDLNWEFPNGASGVLEGLSFALWFYLGIEELPLAVEETIEPARHMPRGVIISMITLFIISILNAVLSATISPGAPAMYESESPLLIGYKTVFGDNNITGGFVWLLMIGLISSFHSFLFYMGKLLYSIAKDGYLPEILTRLHPTRKTTYASLIIGSLIGFVATIVLHFAIGDTDLSSVLINISLIGALVSYALQLVSFIVLRIKQPNRERPYKSVFGVPGAVICLIQCIFIFVTIFYHGITDIVYIASLVASIAFFIIAGIYYYMVVKPKLENGTVLDSAKISMESFISDKKSSMQTP